MSHEMDLSFLETPEILQVIFPVAYSPFLLRDHIQSSPKNGKVYPVEVDKKVNIYCGFWVNSKDSPSIIYFHGNGETVADHGWIAPVYNHLGINIFVADYRGYGSSDGKPTVGNMLNDAHIILSSFQAIIREEGFKGSIFIMGRSLGSLPAIELAFHHQEEINGLIIESGSANNLHRLWGHIGATNRQSLLQDDNVFLNTVKIRQVNKPTLIIHGEYDQILPVAEGRELYQNSGDGEKKLLIIPGADHNDIMIIDRALYFDTISEFVTIHS
jgi:pimeloyl-ACP methyl ester carboxylesterase